MGTNRWLCFAVFAVLVESGCNPFKDDTPQKVCAPGKVSPCPCADGKAGVQACAGDGLGYGACVCDDGKGGSGGASGSGGTGGQSGTGGSGGGGGTPLMCDPGWIACADGSSCIDASWRCDGGSDCPDNSDEVGCAGNGGSAGASGSAGSAGTGGTGATGGAGGTGGGEPDFTATESGSFQDTTVNSAIAWSVVNVGSKEFYVRFASKGQPSGCADFTSGIDHRNNNLMTLHIVQSPETVQVPDFTGGSFDLGFQSVDGINTTVSFIYYLTDVNCGYLSQVKATSGHVDMEVQGGRVTGIIQLSGQYSYSLTFDVPVCGAMGDVPQCIP